MATERQIAANRKNAQKSTGPRTAAGKAASSQNALKHGLSSHRTVILAEDQRDFDLHRREMLDALAPVTAAQSILAERIVGLAWRLKRADTLRSVVIDAMRDKTVAFPYRSLEQRLGQAAEDPSISVPYVILGHIALSDFSNDNILERLLDHEIRIEHQLYKAMSEFQKLRQSASAKPSPHAQTPLPTAPSPQNKPNSTGG